MAQLLEPAILFPAQQVNQCTLPSCGNSILQLYDITFSSAPLYAEIASYSSCSFHGNITHAGVELRQALLEAAHLIKTSDLSGY